MNDATATLLEADGTWTLRFERRYAHPIEKVWRALSEPEHRDVWFPQQIVGDLVAGGELQFVGDKNYPEMTLPGRCIAIDPPRLLEIEWGEDLLHIELQEEGDATRLTFTTRLGERRHAARTGSGWHFCLRALRAELDGETPTEVDEAAWTQLHDQYLETVGGDRHVWGQTPD